MTQVYIKSHPGTSSARNFVLKNGIFTIRTFRLLRSLNPPGFAPATKEEIQRVTSEVGVPMTRVVVPETNYYYSTEIFKDFKGDKNNSSFALSGEISWALDEKYLGKYAVSDRTGWSFMQLPMVGLTFINRTAYRLEYRTPVDYISLMEGAPAIAAIIQQYATSNIEDCIFVLNIEEGMGYNHNFPEATILSDYEAKNLTTNVEATFLPKIKLNNPPESMAPDTTVSCNVDILVNGILDPNANCKIYLDAVSGYVPQKQIQIINGKGSFRAISKDLKATENLIVKVGFKNWVNEADFIVPIK